MAMEHTPLSDAHSAHDMVHMENPSSEQAKMEIMLLKIAIDAVDAYNHVCKDHKIDIVSIDDGSVHNEVEQAIAAQKASAPPDNETMSEEAAVDEEAMAVLSEALAVDDTLAEESTDIDIDADEDVTAEMISDMISNDSQGDNVETEANAEDIAQHDTTALAENGSGAPEINATDHIAPPAEVSTESVLTESENSEEMLVNAAPATAEENADTVSVEQENEHCPHQANTSISTESADELLSKTAQVGPITATEQGVVQEPVITEAEPLPEDNASFDMTTAEPDNEALSSATIDAESTAAPQAEITAESATSTEEATMATDIPTDEIAVEAEAKIEIQPDTTEGE